MQQLSKAALREKLAQDTANVRITHVAPAVPLMGERIPWRKTQYSGKRYHANTGSMPRRRSGVRPQSSTERDSVEARVERFLRTFRP